MICGKRGKGAYNSDCGQVDIYKYYKKDGGKIGRKMHSDICRDVNAMIVGEIIENNYTLKLPFNLGDISLVGKRGRMTINDDGSIDRDTVKTDWARTYKYWQEKYGVTTMEQAKEIPNKKYFYHENRHTGGAYITWYWRRGAIKNIRSYILKINRVVKRGASSYVRTQEVIPYYIVPSGKNYKK